MQIAILNYWYYHEHTYETKISIMLAQYTKSKRGWSDVAELFQTGG